MWTETQWWSELRQSCDLLQDYDTLGMANFEHGRLPCIALFQSTLRLDLQKALRALRLIDDPGAEAAWGVALLGVSAGAPRPTTLFLVYEVLLRRPFPLGLEFPLLAHDEGTQRFVAEARRHGSIACALPPETDPLILELPAGNLSPIMDRYADGEPIAPEEWLEYMVSRKPKFTWHE